MIQPYNNIQDAINAAEIVAKPIGRDNEPVTVTNGTLLTLIEAAKQWQGFYEESDDDCLT